MSISFFYETIYINNILYIYIYIYLHVSTFSLNTGSCMAISLSFFAAVEPASILQVRKVLELHQEKEVPEFQEEGQEYKSY